MRRAIILLIVLAIFQAVSCDTLKVVSVLSRTNGTQNAAATVKATQEASSSKFTGTLSGLTASQQVKVTVTKYGALDTNTKNSGSLLGAQKDAKLVWTLTANAQGSVTLDKTTTLLVGNGTDSVVGCGVSVTDVTSSKVLLQGVLGREKVTNNVAENTAANKVTCELRGVSNNNLYGRVNLQLTAGTGATLSARICGMNADSTNKVKVSTYGDLTSLPASLGAAVQVATVTSDSNGQVNATATVTLTSEQKEALLGSGMLLEAGSTVVAACVSGTVNVLPPLDLVCGGATPTTAAPTTGVPTTSGPNTTTVAPTSSGPTPTTAAPTTVSGALTQFSSLFVIMVAVLVFF